MKTFTNEVFTADQNHRVLDVRRAAGSYNCWAVSYGNGHGWMMLCRTRAEARRFAANANRAAAVRGGTRP